MVQVALVIISICLIVLGCKGFTPGGLALSKTKTLTGRPARIVGVLCILGGISLIPLMIGLVYLTMQL